MLDLARFIEYLHVSKELDAAWPVVPASPLRRIAAWLLDYLLIAAYLVLLTAVSLSLRLSPMQAEFDSAMSQPLTAELLGFFLLTLPVVLYFALFEASPLRATLGKRALRLAVVELNGFRLSMRRALLREAVRFVPWELSHALLWRVALGPHGGSIAWWVTAGFGVLYALVLVYLVTMFIGSQHRTVYDRLAGSIVIRR
ncbi:MAG TPA: RDD family protein [Candidatus Dormibacteraeota bacterium]|nr:RDD family protein [Candidatus Dormibacteraeota bacterium]